MIEIQQWRAAIGCFSHPKSAKHKTVGNTSAHDLNDLCVRLFMTAVLLWGVYMEHIIIKTALNTLGSAVIPDFNISVTLNHSFVTSINYEKYMQPFVNTLVLCMDVETNPGPGIVLSPEMQQVVIAINDNVNARFDVIQHQMERMRQEIGSIRTDMNNLREKVDSVQRTQAEASREAQRMSERIEALETECDKQQQYSRKENLIFHGIMEQADESFANLRTRAVNLLNANVTGKVWTEGDILDIHRLPSKAASNKTPPLIIRFLRFRDKVTVLKARSQFNNLNIDVKSDLTNRQRELLKNVPDGKYGYFKAGKLVIADKRPNNGSKPNEHHKA